MGTEKATIAMDARKFARHVNNGAAAKLKFFEDAVKRMGAQVEQNLRLTSLDSTSLIFEDVEKNKFYMADIKKATRGKVDLDNIRQIQITESEKPDQFNKNCHDLIDAICEDNLKMADKVLGRIESQRYQSHVIPDSGWITFKDDVARHVKVSNRIVAENHAEKIVNLISEAIEDQVVLDRGRIVRGSLSDGSAQLTIPINEYTRRRLVAHKMRTVAENAYKSTSFCDFVLQVGSHLCESDMKNACRLTAKFLAEEQEFCLLTSKQFNTLVENTLAAKGEFNSFLARDIAKVLYETNIAINKDTIVESWTKAAQKAENPSLLRNVGILAESDSFSRDHDEFLNLVFNEEMDVQSARAKAYRTTLKIIAGILPELDEEEDVASIDELNELIERLSSTEPDTDAVLQAEELLASISDSLIDNIQSLEGFDQEPGEEEDVEDDAEGGEFVNLPEVGEGGEEEAEEGEEEGEEDLGTLPPPAGEEEGGFPLAADAEHPGKSSKISSMNVNKLLESVEDWRLNAETYLVEHGYDKCNNALNSFVKRCMDIGPQANVISESFEGMRAALLESNGQKILSDLDLAEDPYSDALAVALNGPTKIIGSSNSADPERDPDFVGRNVAESKINRDYVHVEDAYPGARVPSGVSAASDDLHMDDLQGGGGVSASSSKKSDGRSAGGETGGFDQKQRGTGVQNKGLKPVDGRSGHHSTSGAAGGDLRMDDKQGGGGVQSKGLHSSDGRKGGVGSSTAAESTVPTSGGATNKTDLSMGSDYQGKSGKGSVTGKGLQNSDGTSGTGAKSGGSYEASGGPSAVALRMDDLQGGDGVEDSGLSHDHPGDSKTDTKSASSGGDMSKGQGKDGVTKNNKGMNETFTPENIAALIAEMEDEACDGGCPTKGSCGKDCSCPDGCDCKKKAVSESKDCDCDCDPCECDDKVKTEGELPDALKKHMKKPKGESDDDDDDDDSDSDDSDSDSDSDDDDDGGNPFAEAQRKGPTRRKKGGRHRSSIEDRDKKTKSEGKETGEQLVEMDDDLDMGGDDSTGDAVGAVNKLLTGLEDVIADVKADLNGESDELDADITGDELGDLEGAGEDMDGLDDDLGGVEDDSDEISAALADDDGLGDEDQGDLAEA